MFKNEINFIILADGWLTRLLHDVDVVDNKKFFSKFAGDHPEEAVRDEVQDPLLPLPVRAFT